MPCASGATITFNNREEVNIVNNLGVLIAANQTWQSSGLQPGDLIAARETANTSDWVGFGSDNYLTLQWDTIQNIKTIKTWDQFSGYSMTNVTIETSNNGNTWTTQAATLTNVDGNRDTIVLDSAVNAKYLRIQATGLDRNGVDDQWRIAQLRVYGDVGTLTANSKQDYLASQGFSTPITVSAVGTVPTDALTLSQMIDDNPVALNRQVAYNINQGDGLVFDFGQALPVDTVALFMATVGLAADTRISINLSNDGVSYVTAIDQTGWSPGLNLFELGGASYQYMKLLVEYDADGTGVRFSDFMVMIPEPASALLLLCGGLAMARRRR